MTDVLSLAPDRVAALLRKERITLAWAVLDNGKVRVSHDVLAPLVQYFEDPRSGFSKHEAVFLRPHAELDLLLGAFVHDTTRGAGAGGTRLWAYDDLRSYLRDGLRLAQGMTRKNSLAGLFWGGGKGVIGMGPGGKLEDRAQRDAAFNAYGDMMTALRGCYVTAEDVGVFTRDIAAIHARTRFVTCIPSEIGGSGDPSPSTARGVIAGMQAALAYRKLGTLADKTIVVQGIGNVGGPLLSLLFEHGVKKVIASDVSETLIDKRRRELAGKPLELRLLARGDSSILTTPCDILAPCALGAVINADTIPQLQTKIVCGAANNQLDDPTRDGRALRERGITYVPDFLTNRMGIVNCANEQYGYVTPDPAIERHFGNEFRYSIPTITHEVLTRAERDGVPEGDAAIALADELAREPHPIFPGRSRAIIEALTRA